MKAHVALARQSLIYEWRRFLPAILAVGFAGLLQVLQAALVFGIFSSASVTVSGSAAQLWVGYPGTQSVDQGRPLDPALEMRVRMDPAVDRVESFRWIDGDWRGPRNRGGVSVYVSGIDPRHDGLMFAHVLPWTLRARLREPGGVIVDRADLDKLGADIGTRGVINGQPVHVVGVTSGLRALGGVNVLASLDTSRSLDSEVRDAGRPTYLVASVRPGADLDEVARRLSAGRGWSQYQVWTAAAFARQSILFWLMDSGAGAGVLFMAGIVFLVGAVITSQTLVGAVAGSMRDYATLNALGVGVSALRRVVLEQALWVGGLGLAGAALLGAVLMAMARYRDVPVRLNLPVIVVCSALIMLLAMVSGVAAMRSLRHADPASLLR